MAKHNPVYDWVAKQMGKMGDKLKVRWSYTARRATTQYYELYHTSPRLDPLHDLADDVASAPFVLYSKADKRRDPDSAVAIVEHAIYDILDNPMPDHPEIDGHTLRYLTEVYYGLIGECFWLVDKPTRGGDPVAIYMIPPSWVVTTPYEGAPYYLVQPYGNTAGSALHVDAADIVWFKNPDISLPYGRGRGRTEAIGDELETDEYSAKYAKNFYYNDATPSILIEAAGATQDEVERIKENWFQKVGGWLNARKPAFATWDNVKIHKLMDSPRELDFVESRKFLRDACNQHFAQPPELRGILENSNRSTIDSAYYLWTKNVVTKELNRFASTLNRQFLPMFRDGKQLVLEFKSIVPEDTAYKLQVANEGIARGTITRNEWRIANGFKPDDERGDVYLMPMSIMEVKAEDDEPIPEPPDGGKEPVEEEPELEEDESEAEEPEEKSGCACNIVAPQSTVKGLEERARKAYWNSFDTKAASGEDMFSSAMGTVFKRQDKAIRRLFKMYVNGGMSYAEAVDKTLADVFGPNADKAVRDGLAPAWLTSMKQGMDLAAELLGSPISFDVTNPAFTAWINSNGLALAKGINDTTAEMIRKVMAEGIREGESIPKIAKRIHDAFDEATKVRATLIARTETTSSVNLGAFASYKAAGVTRKEWIATYDSRTREDHMTAQGQIVGIDETFTVGGESLMYPGDPSGSAANNCNCRCTVAPVME